jgi:4-hydroxy-2-oxoheptanedioate aldolase
MPITPRRAMSLSGLSDMQLPENRLKRALRGGQTHIGLWHGLFPPYVTELLAGTGFDWLCPDGEHSPSDHHNLLAQLQAIATYPVAPVVRTVSDDVALIKQYLDIGVQTLLIPMVETGEQATRVVAATRYPPRGIRGVGAALARASRWNQIPNYLQRCEEELCVLVQVESVAGIENLAAIAHTDGIDGVFFGPSDLAASMGLLGKSGDARVQAAIVDGISTVRAAGKAAGVLTVDAALARKYIELGATFVAVGLDTSLLVRAATDLAKQFTSV